MTGAKRHPVLEGNRSSNHLIIPIAIVGELELVVRFLQPETAMEM